MEKTRLKEKILIIDGCMAPFTVALHANGKNYCWNSDNDINIPDGFLAGDLSAILPEVIQDLCLQAGCSLKNLTHICVPKGPGTFTGIRIALSIGQGIGFGSDCKVLSPTYLEGLAFMVGYALKNGILKSWKMSDFEDANEFDSIVKISQGNYCQSRYKFDNKGILNSLNMDCLNEDQFDKFKKEKRRYLKIMGDNKWDQCIESPFFTQKVFVSKAQLWAEFCHHVIEGEMMVELGADFYQLTPFYAVTPSFKKRHDI